MTRGEAQEVYRHIRISRDALLGMPPSNLRKIALDSLYDALNYCQKEMAVDFKDNHAAKVAEDKFMVG